MIMLQQTIRAGNFSSCFLRRAMVVFALLQMFLFVLPVRVVYAKSVALAGLMGGKAMVVVDGASPKLMRPGQEHKGVKLLSVQTDKQQVKVRTTSGVLVLRVGDLPVHSGARRSVSSGSTLIMQKGRGGHFFADGFINGKSVKFMVDTGATTVAMGANTAKEIGIDYTKVGQPVFVGTANGMARAWSVKLKTIRIQNVTLKNVDAVVSTDMPFVLLGNSFLGRFNMQTQNDLLMLKKKY